MKIVLAGFDERGFDIHVEEEDDTDNQVKQQDEESNTQITKTRSVYRTPDQNRKEAFSKFSRQVLPFIGFPGIRKKRTSPSGDILPSVAKFRRSTPPSRVAKLHLRVLHATTTSLSRKITVEELKMATVKIVLLGLLKSSECNLAAGSASVQYKETKITVRDTKSANTQAGRFHVKRRDLSRMIKGDSGTGRRDPIFAWAAASCSARCTSSRIPELSSIFIRSSEILVFSPGCTEACRLATPIPSTSMAGFWCSSFENGWDSWNSSGKSIFDVVEVDGLSASGFMRKHKASELGKAGDDDSFNGGDSSVRETRTLPGPQTLEDELESSSVHSFCSREVDSGLVCSISGSDSLVPSTDIVASAILDYNTYSFNRRERVEQLGSRQNWCQKRLTEKSLRAKKVRRIEGDAERFSLIAWSPASWLIKVLSYCGPSHCIASTNQSSY